MCTEDERRRALAETIVITRGGHRVAVISPAPASNGGALREFGRRWTEQLDENFSAEVTAARTAVELDGNPWANV
ncbi:MAG TPA: hypothetical protein VGR21_07620 [Cryptosporangiaceae bacterium]|nr:hypothetical protein [Cryptosporangiaceae bacterium]